VKTTPNIKNQEIKKIEPNQGSDNLREDWIECTLGEILTIERGGSPRPIKEFLTQDKNGVNWIKIGDATNSGKYILKTVQKIKPTGLKKSREVFPGDLLLSNSMSFGRPYIMGIKGAIHDGWLVIRDNKYLDKDFLYYALSSPTTFNQFSKKAKGSTVKNLNIGLVSDVNIKLVSLPTQKAIVKKIEELFSSLDSGIADLKKAQDQLVIYRQAVLKKAFEGELTNTKISNGDLPINWNWASIFDFLFDNKKGMATGPFGTALKKHEHKQEGVPVLGIENIGEGKFKMPNKIFVTPEKSIELKSFKVLENDIIISRSGTVGEICSIPKQMENSLISTNLIRVRLDLEKVLPKFFVYLFQGGNVREQVKELCKGSTRVFLNQTILKKLKLPLCSIEEQKEVIKEIESRLSVCDKVEKDIADSLQKAQALRQSILKKG